MRPRTLAIGVVGIVVACAVSTTGVFVLASRTSSYEWKVLAAPAVSAMDGVSSVACTSRSDKCVLIGWSSINGTETAAVSGDGARRWQADNSSRVLGGGCGSTACGVVEDSDGATSAWLSDFNHRGGVAQLRFSTGTEAAVGCGLGGSQCVVLTSSPPGGPSTPADTYVLPQSGGMPQSVEPADSTFAVENLQAPTNVVCDEKNACFGFSNNALWRTNDLGRQWRHPTFSGTTSLSCPAPSKCFMGVFNSTTLATTNGGGCWRAVGPVSTKEKGCVGVSRITNSRRYVASIACWSKFACLAIEDAHGTSAFAAVEVTWNAGSVWTPMSTPPGDVPAGVACGSWRTHCVIVALQGSRDALLEPVHGLRS